jgi:hypothetical protein
LLGGSAANNPVEMRARTTKVETYVCAIVYSFTVCLFTLVCSHSCDRRSGLKNGLRATNSENVPMFMTPSSPHVISGFTKIIPPRDWIDSGNHE